MSHFVAISRPHLLALIDAALSDTASPPDTAIILGALNELQAPPVSEAPTSQDVRDCFEAACKQSKSFNFPLGIVTLNGRFQNYMDSDTDSAFVGYRAGFVRGLKWQIQAQQLIANAQAQAAPAEGGPHLGNEPDGACSSAQPTACLETQDSN